MGVRILHDHENELACLFCSTSDVAFGPVFSASKAPHWKDADERAEAFCRWIQSPFCGWLLYGKVTSLTDSRRDPRILTEEGLQSSYSAWMLQEDAQYSREEAAERAAEDEVS